MITFLIEMLELSNFGNMTTPSISFKSSDKVLGDVKMRNYDLITFILK